MSRIQLFIAASIDGFIARKDHSIDWLDAMDQPTDGDYGYGEFIAGIDAVIMGRKTYELVLGFDVDWPYSEQNCYVVSSNAALVMNTPKTKVISDLNAEMVEEIRRHSTKNIWLVGGGSLVTQFMKLDAVDDIFLSIIPIVLGSGIPLFPGGSKETNYVLMDSKAYSTGAVVLNYRRGE